MLAQDAPGQRAAGGPPPAVQMEAGAVRPASPPLVADEAAQPAGDPGAAEGASAAAPAGASGAQPGVPQPEVSPAGGAGSTVKPGLAQARGKRAAAPAPREDLGDGDRRALEKLLERGSPGAVQPR